ncbi:MAG TPA: PAS domain-containing sensor histidine kinase [Methylomirabilota bacterium]|nr:PAS domain-containing sensor histidine kinase [Methylomirabilota bacterium]
MRIQDIQRLMDRSLDPMVHGSVAADDALAARHRRFIGAHFTSGSLALALIPLTLVARDAPALVPIALAVLGMEALAALYVSRTGRLEIGHLFSAAVLTSTVIMIAGATGGLASFALMWFAVAPIEASMTGDRRVIHGAAAIGATGFAAVAAMSLSGMLPPPLPTGSAAAVASGVVALVYAATVAYRVDAGHREGERRRRAGEARYRLLADTMTDMVTCHGADGDVVFASPATERLLDATPREICGDGLFRRVHVADRPAYLTAVSTALHDGSAAAEFRLRSGDAEDADTWIWVEMLLRRAASDDGAWPVVAVTRDIGRHKALEAELEKAREDAEMASFAKTRFLANMSHELRTPLNAIIGFSDILGQEMFGKFEFERHREYSRLIKESGEHLLQVVNDILDMSKIEAGSFDVTPEPFDLPAVIDRCRQLMTPQAAQAGVELVMAVEPQLPELVADRRACRQILLNLLSNAVKFTETGGRVECGARRDGRRIAIYVKDNGIGVAPEDLPRLGNPFFQADCGYNRRHEGTGLGLSVVKGLAALHGGSMQIDSAPGKGTTVTIHLPLGTEREPISLPPRTDRRPDDAETAPRAVKRA